MEFDRKKILTIATCEQAQVGQKGWFGSTLEGLEASMKKKPMELKNILAGGADYPFFDGEYRHLYFYPAQESSYEERQRAWIKENDVKVGTMVRITRDFTDNEDGSICFGHIGAEGETGTINCILESFIRVSVDGYCVEWNAPFTALEVLEGPSYEERQAKWVSENDVKVGTKVRLVKGFKEYAAGRKGTVEYILASGGIGARLDGGDFYAVSVPFTILEVLKEPVKYRPFNEAELNQLVGKVIMKKSTGKRSIITETFKMTISSGFGINNIDARNLLEYYTFDDGTPCGVEEEKD
jgi:transcription antitermination factor NusG